MKTFDKDNYQLARIKPVRLKSSWWIGHIPFAFELINALRPNTVVELGTYNGSSFCAFCQMINHLKVPAKCYGIDTWEGDIHMGKLDHAIYSELSEYCKNNYQHTAILIKREFNDAIDLFEDKSIDLLHIDGTHTYAAVSNDFYTWLPKVSDRGVVLFHDTNVSYENIKDAAKDFGVKHFFDSIKDQYPHIEFTHCYGLGVLVVGKETPQAVMDMVKQSREPEFVEYFAQLGEHISREFECSGCKRFFRILLSFLTKMSGMRKE